jgi:hypothetical protein
MKYNGTATDVLTERPPCDFCQTPAAVDGATHARAVGIYVHPVL